MSTPRFIRQEPASTPADHQTSRPSARQLPDDLLREASRRLGIISLLGLVLWVTATLLEHMAASAMSHGAQGGFRLRTTDGIALAGAFSSFVFYRYARTTDREPAFVLDLGLAYLVFTSLLIALIWHWEPVPGGWPVQPMFTWIGVLVLIFAAIVPNSPAKTLWTGLLAVSMNPIGMLIARERGTWLFGALSNVILMHYPDYMLVGVAVVISLVVTRLGQQVSRAREMGSYQLGDLLGRGGMGEVYRATHRMLARPAAIKLIRPEMIAAGGGAAAQLAVKRFRREAEVAANLRSPHTVELYDFGVTEDQTFYFVMELLEGMNLDLLVRHAGPVPASRVIHILRQICDSLEEAHASGLVHRDIKPANIHIGRLGLHQDFVKVLDFGLVKSMTATTGEHSMATGIGMTPGTPDYMAPEMLMGEPVDGRADLYAVGCVGYYLLTAKPVFDGSTVYAVIARHLNDVPIAPSVRVGVAVPAELDRLIMACLAKRPAERPQTAGALDSALAAIAAEPWTQEDARRWWTTAAPGATL